MFAYNEQKQDTKSMSKTSTRDVVRAARIKRTAEIVRVSVRYVQLVLNGDRADEEVLSVFMTLDEGENKLVQAVKEMIPFN